MQNRPDPDSPEMGYLVDQWLVSLRKTGMKPAQLARYVQELGRASNQIWMEKNDIKNEAVIAFFDWLAQHGEGYSSCSVTKIPYTEK